MIFVQFVIEWKDYSVSTICEKLKLALNLTQKEPNGFISFRFYDYYKIGESVLCRTGVNPYLWDLVI